MSLKSRQIELLRFIDARGAVSTRELDGRVLRPLLEGGYVSDLAGAIRVTLGAREFLARIEDQNESAGGVQEGR